MFLKASLVLTILTIGKVLWRRGNRANRGVFLECRSSVRMSIRPFLRRSVHPSITPSKFVSTWYQQCVSTEGNKSNEMETIWQIQQLYFHF